MKIRTDFVTNSSSSSFVIYSLKNSELLKYIYERMNESGIELDDYIGNMIDEDDLYMEIRTAETSCYSSNHYDYDDEDDDDFDDEDYDDDDDFDDEDDDFDDDELLIDHYAPEIYQSCFRFRMNIFDIEDYLADESSKIKFRELFAKKFQTRTDETELIQTRFFDSFSDTYEDPTFGEYDINYEFGSYRYSDYCSCRVFADKAFCKELFLLLQSGDCNRHIIKYKDRICIVSDLSAKNERDHIYVFEDRIFLISFDGYSKAERRSDIDTLTSCFIDTLIHFQSEIGTACDRQKMEELFEKDKKAGRFFCDVYMGEDDG